MLSDHAVFGCGHTVREKKEQKPRQTSICSFSTLAARALCQLMHEGFLKASSGINYCLRQEDAPHRCSHRFCFLQQCLCVVLPLVSIPVSPSAR